MITVNKKTTLNLYQYPDLWDIIFDLECKLTVKQKWILCGPFVCTLHKVRIGNKKRTIKAEGQTFRQSIINACCQLAFVKLGFDEKWNEELPTKKNHIFLVRGNFDRLSVFCISLIMICFLITLIIRSLM